MKKLVEQSSAAEFNHDVLRLVSVYEREAEMPHAVDKGQLVGRARVVDGLLLALHFLNLGYDCVADAQTLDKSVKRAILRAVFILPKLPKAII